MRRIIVFFMLAIMGTAAIAETPSEKNRIDYLLHQLATSDVTFIRNGEKHDGGWAKAHLEKKWKDSGKADMTADAFIAGIASTSSHSGKPYLIMTKDGKTVEAAEWLKAKLAAMPQN